MTADELLTTYGHLTADQPLPVSRSEDDKQKAREAIADLGLSQNVQFATFYTNFRAGNFSTKHGVELLDVSSPSRQIEDTWKFAKDTYELDEDFVPLTSGEGEGFILMDRRDGQIFDVGIDQFDALEDGRLTPNWKDFLSFIQWFVD